MSHDIFRVLVFCASALSRTAEVYICLYRRMQEKIWLFFVQKRITSLFCVQSNAVTQCMTVGPKLHFFYENDFLSLRIVQFQTNLLPVLAKTVSKNFFAKLVKNAIKNSVALVLCTKLYRKLAVSHTMFFIASRELI